LKTAAALLLTAPLATQQVPTFTTSVDVVYVDAFVTRDGRAVAGLVAGDFDVRDNGVRQDVTLVSVNNVPIAAVMVFDVSASVAGARLDDLRAAGRALLAGLRPQDQAALVTFSHEVHVAVPLGRDRSTVRRAVDGLTAGGQTALWDGLYVGLKTAEGAGRPMVVLFTDGLDDLSWLSAEQVSKVARESEALIHVVAITRPAVESATEDLTALRHVEQSAVQSVQLRRVREIAELTGGRLWPADASAQLEPTFLSILAEMQSWYLLSFKPMGVPREGWHRLSVKLSGRKGTVRSRIGYFVPGSGRESVP
jgi:VWFA-related protein